MDTTPSIVTRLRSLPIFFELSPDQIDKIALIADLIEIDPGDQLISEGARLDFVYILLEGEIDVEISVPLPSEVVNASHLGPLDFIGWSALTPIIRQRTATATALTHCWLIRMDAKLLSNLCEKDHDIGFAVYKRVANATAMSFLTIRNKFLNFLSETN